MIALGVILVGYLALATGYALTTPPWNNPDEPAHYNYLAGLATTGRLPVLQPGDWDSQRLGERLSSGRFTTGEPIDDYRYEGHQPPLYYLLLSPLYRAAAEQPVRSRVALLRGASIGLGALLIVVAYLAGRLVAPRRPELAPLAAGLIAFIPMQTAMTATINNDTLAELLAATTLLVVLFGLQRGFGARGALAVGALGGGLLITKLTVYPFVPLAYLALALETAGPNRPRRLGRATLYLTLALLVTAALAGWWFWRNLTVYGLADPFGLRRHDLVVVGQPRWPGLGLEPVVFFGYSLFRSFWAQFGWMAVVIDPRLYGLFLLLGLLSIVGLVRFWRAELPDWPPAQVLGLRFLLAGLGLVLAEVVLYNLSFIQAQGRYLYPAMLPIAILLGLGWVSLAELPLRGARWRRPAFALGLYWVSATGLEALSWLLLQGPAAPILHLFSAATAWVAGRAQLLRPRTGLAGPLAAGLVAVLALVDLAALTRFVAPYFQGW